uniref:non-specific serine/threonine protein kinase n=1 Tax=Araucaria cunninghamii TaxID=56994 RepID=A0A0D6R3P3_ARACU
MKMEELRPVKVVGRGAMGTVFLIQKQGCDKLLALKAISKSVMAKKGDFQRRAQIEKDILSRLDHPFLPALLGHVETENIVGWVVDYCPGGDLNALRHRQTEKKFPESIIRFYTAEIVLALEHLHGQGIVYRDLKPENVLIQANGHIMLTDFDLSTRLSPKQQQQEVLDLANLGLQRTSSKQRRSPGQLDSVVSYLRRAATTRASSSFSQVLRSSSARFFPRVGSEKKKNQATAPADATGSLNAFVGTEDYVAPEVLSRTGHDFAVDWWALGVLLYEMLYGTTPFKGSTRTETFYRILVKQPEFTGPWSPLSDLIDRLLSKEPDKRLGSRNGAHDVKNHIFFEGLDWEAVQDVSRAPFVPAVVSIEALGNVTDIADCVEKLKTDVMSAGLNNEHKHSGWESEDYGDLVPPNWAERLSRARTGDALGVF